MRCELEDEFVLEWENNLNFIMLKTFEIILNSRKNYVNSD